MAKQLIFSENARRALKTGVDALANAVKVTLGPTSGTVTVAVELRSRQPFVAATEAKGWNEPDGVMEQVHATIGIAP